MGSVLLAQSVGATVALLGLTALLVLAAIARAVCRKRTQAGKELSSTSEEAPGPTPWPVIGSLHLLGQYEVPFEAFTALSKLYGEVYSITLGSSSCVVVNSYKYIKEVLITKGSHFGGRPNFARFHKLFGGDRDNSLALCDWSDLQKTRRSIARIYCSPRFASAHFDNLASAGCAEIPEMLGELWKHEGSAHHAKPLFMAVCANVFSQYMCSIRFDYEDVEFQQMVRHFDDIFWDINQGYAVDFMPWLLPLYQGHMRRLSGWAGRIRQFILKRVIEHHRETLDRFNPRDFTDALLVHLEEDPNMNWQHIIFELEDFLGGHSAVGNLVMLILGQIVHHPGVGREIQREADAVTRGQRHVSLFDKEEMPYTEATIWETLRKASSPIVPHVATQDTTISGYVVKKGTTVFINNLELNTSPSYWEHPEEFRPERFLRNGKVKKPEYFIPFSTGKRTCIGSRLVQTISFLVVANVLQQFDVTSTDARNIKLPKGSVALPPDTFPLLFTARK